jgi:hypothetical protein
MPLSYLRGDCHKQAVTHIWELRRFESMYTLQEKSWQTCHTLSALSPRMVYEHTYLTRSTYSNLSYSRQQIWTDPLHPRRRAPDTTANGAVGKSQAFVDNRLLGLPGPYHQHAIGMFNICSRGPTHRSLTDTGGGYNLRGAGLPRTTPWPYQPAVSPFHLRAPPGLQFNQVLITKPKFWV